MVNGNFSEHMGEVLVVMKGVFLAQINTYNIVKYGAAEEVHAKTRAMEDSRERAVVAVASGHEASVAVYRLVDAEGAGVGEERVDEIDIGTSS